VIVYLLPRAGYFKSAFVFGQKATDEIMTGSVASEIRQELASAKAYREGRGIRIQVRDAGILRDIELLVNTMLAH